jgi:hypothetical protein
MADDCKPDALTLARRGLARRGLFRRLALLGAGGAAVASGLTVGTTPAAEAQGYPPMPPPRFEGPPPPPRGPRYVWQPGHWRWTGNRYVWFQGRYIPRGRHYARFVPGHWGRRYGQWVWVPQHCQ